MAIYDIYLKNFKSWVDGTVVENWTPIQSIPITGEVVFNNPTVKNEIGKAGSFEFGLEYDSPCYNALMQMKTLVQVQYFGRTIFRGRVLTIDRGLSGSRKVHCEGDLSFLLDSVQPPTEEASRPVIDLATYLGQLLTQHNSCVYEADKMFELGEVPGHYTTAAAGQQVPIPEEKAKQQFGSNSWGTTLDRLEELVGDFGGYLRTRVDDTTGGRYLDWLDNYYDANINPQSIEIAKNLIDISGTTEVDTLFTVVVPVGKANGHDLYISDYWPVICPGHEKCQHITVPELATIPLFSDAELNVDYHRKEDYAEAITRFGNIWTTVSFANANTPEKLFNYCKDWMRRSFSPDLTQWSVTALDLGLIENQNTSPIYVGDRVALSHKEETANINVFTVISVDYNLYSPEQTKYTIGIPNPQVNTSYGVPIKETKSSSNAGKGKKGSGNKKPPKDGDGEKTPEEVAAENLQDMYIRKTEFGEDIGLDDPLAFVIWKPDGTQYEGDEAKKRASWAANLMARTKAELYSDLVEEARRRGCAWDDTQLVIDFTPELKQAQVQWKIEFERYAQNTLGMSPQETQVLLNDSSSSSWLASLVDDDGNWTQAAIRAGYPDRPNAAELRQMAINTRRQLNGTYKPDGQTRLDTTQGFLSALGIDLGDWGSMDSLTQNFNLGDMFNLSGEDLTARFGELFNMDLDQMTAYFGDVLNIDLSNFTFDLEGINAWLNGSTGHSLFGRSEDDQGNVSWNVMLNHPVTYTGSDGQQHTTLMVSANDINLPQLTINGVTYDSLRMRLMVVDELIANRATIGQLQATEATIAGLTVNVEYLRSDFEDTANGLYSRIEQTASYIRSELEDVNNGLYSRIEQTASYIRSEVADTANGLESKIEQTASYIRSEVSDTANGLESKIEQTASYIRSEVSDTANGLESKIEQTASYIRSEVSDTANGLESKIEQTASYIRSEVSDTANGLESKIEQTASYIRSEVSDTANGLESKIEQTASYIRSEVADTANGLESKIEQTASYIRSEVADTANGLESKIEQTASYIRSEVADTANGLESKIEQTASYIRSEVSDTANGLESKIEQTASSIRSTIADTKSDLESEIEQTASSIRSTVRDTKNDLQTQINQNAENIELKVSKTDVDDEVTSVLIGLNNVTIEGGDLIVQGMVTADSLATQIANISGFLEVSQLKITNTMQLDTGATFVVPASSGGISVAASKLTISSGSGEGTTTITPSSFLKEVQIVPVSGSTSQYKLQYKTAFASSWTDAGTFSKAVSLRGAWDGSTYTVSATSGAISGTVPSTTVYQTITGTPNPSETVYANVYKDNPSDATNVILTNELTLVENVASKKVSLMYSTLEKGAVSTEATYTAGQNDLKAAGGSVTKNTNGSFSLKKYVTTLNVGVHAADYTAVGNPAYDSTTHLLEQQITVLDEENASISDSPLTVRINPSSFLEAKTGSSKITANGTYTPGTGKIGFSSVVVDVDVDTSTAYNTGWGNAYDDVSLPAAGTGASFDVTTPSSTVDGTPTSITYTLQENGSNQVQIVDGSNTIAQLTHNQNTLGYSAARGSYTTTGGVLKISKTRNGSAFPLSFAINAGISYNSSTHKYTAKASVDDTEMDTAVGDTQAYQDGQSSVSASLSVGWNSSNAKRLDISAIKTIDGVDSVADSETVTIAVSADGWSNGSNTVSAKHGTHVIDSTTLTVGDGTWVTPVWAEDKKSVTATVNVRGKDISTVINTTDAWTKGQTDLIDAGGTYGPVRTNGPHTLNQYVTTLTVDVDTGTGITGLAIDTTNHQITTSTSSTDQSVTITCEKVARSYTASTNTYVQVFQSKADSSVIATVTDSFVATDAYNAGRDSMWLYSGGTGSNGPLWPGNYAIKEGGSSGTIHGSWVVPSPWLYVVSSGTPLGTLEYDTLIQTGCENGSNKYYTPGAIWKTPPVPTLEMSTAGATVTARMMNGTTELGSDSRTVSTSLGFSFAGPFNNTTTMRAEMGWASGAGTSKGTLTSAKYYAIEASAGGTTQRIYFRTP